MKTFKTLLFMKKIIGFITVLFVFIVGFRVHAQDTLWNLKDKALDKVPGISLKQAYDFAQSKKKKTKTVLVAIIDSGVDIYHEDLQGKIWTNPNEIDSNGIDDDKNGYIDDVHGWNFIGGADGRNVEGDTYEMVRLYSKGCKKFDGKSKSQIAKSDKTEYEEWLKAKTEYETEYASYIQNKKRYEDILPFFVKADPILAKAMGVEKFDINDLTAFKGFSKDEQAIVKDYIMLNGYNLSRFNCEEMIEYFNSVLNTKLNKDYNPRYIIGDDENNINDSIYGNGDVKGKSSGHGTMCAGVIAANRENGIGSQGICSDVKLMVIRVVPGGDERDKDVALGIRYAVKMGAKVINCSFGKSYSPNKWMVDAAIKFAKENDVLIVHASGNDASNIDVETNFPKVPESISSVSQSNWLDVGASTNQLVRLAASYTNFGKNTVDVFAPGSDIFSTSPENFYSFSSGTSCAAPVVTGVAAMIRSYYPQLTANQVRNIIAESAIVYKQKVPMPGEKKKRISFKKLSKTGGLVNAYEAIKLAEQRSNP